MIAAWKCTVQARADVKEAHEKPIDAEATERAADGKAALRNDTTKEAIYEQKVAAWIECFQTKADGRKVKKKAAKKEAGARAGTTWEFAPAGCQLRNGLAKAGVPATKRTGPP